MRESFTLLPADEVSPVDLHAAFGAAFADYLLGPSDLPLTQWPSFIARQCVRLDASRVALAGGELRAFALAAPRPDQPRWRLGTMGVVPAARGSGAAQILLDDFIARAGAAGQRGVELECFAQNQRALRLYASRGFEVVHALHGYRGMPVVGAEETSQAPVQAVALADAFAWLDAAGRCDAALPLQVMPASLRALPVHLQAWRSGRAQLIARAAPGGTVTVHSLVDQDGAQAAAGRLLRELAQRFPGQPVWVPQLQREDLGGLALQRLGWQRLPLHQVLMRKDW
ncbi:GNAT family N-acetyltransferase [Ramlibacter sp.]|uniref:GNAT family N-acetyltransferase n=1 Tax=Ramlibacter sp. TaxID=1917967 RepID=UPI002BE96223|nr:GNAT family N-acetyltransferase [Ramlibacter sp.]HWI83565.1 GNAT family N-acetyltransferase [Ramlibacter sp.]